MPELESFLAVQEQINHLAHFYANYSSESARREFSAKGLARIGEWFSGANRFSNDSMHAKFYEEVQQRTSQIERLIAPLESEDLRHQAAVSAINVIFQPVEESQRDVGDWMRFAAEPLMAPFLPYLKRSALDALYERYNKLYPKRLQFPTQVKLRKTMEMLLAK